MAVEAKNLGKVSGLCACFTKKTLNGRPYEKIYRDILDGKNYSYNAMMKRGGILCELGHPAQQSADFERTDTAEDKACVLIQKIEQKEKGKLYAEGVILDTPAGQVFRAMAPYYKFGFSSRGSYEADDFNSEGPNGWNQETYIFKGFDIVALPANEESVIAVESVNNKKTKKRLTSKEALDLNEIASATNIDRDEVEAELDKLFDTDGRVAETELVKLEDVTDKEDTEQEEDKVEEIDSEEANPKEEPAARFQEPKNSHEMTAEEVASLVQDLRVALKEKYDLAKVLENLAFEKSTNDAKVISLTAQLSEKTAELRKTAMELEQVRATTSDHLEELNSLYGKVTAEDDSRMSQLITARESLEQRLTSLQKDSDKQAAVLETYKQAIVKNKATYESLKGKYVSAKEELNSLRRAQSATESVRVSKETNLTQQLQTQKQATESLNERLKAANNALISMTSSMYDVDSKVLASRLTKSFTPIQLQRAAESLSKDAIRAVEFVQPTLQGKIAQTFRDEVPQEEETQIANMLALE